jgi:hypothetical protein
VIDGPLIFLFNCSVEKCIRPLNCNCSFELGGGNSWDGFPAASGTYYLPGATGKGRTKFRGAICIAADDNAYDVDGGSNVVFNDGDGDEPVCDFSFGVDATDDNTGDLQWGEIKIGEFDVLP